jgi:hypothetical protein
MFHTPSHFHSFKVHRPRHATQNTPSLSSSYKSRNSRFHEVDIGSFLRRQPGGVSQSSDGRFASNPRCQHQRHAHDTEATPFAFLDKLYLQPLHAILPENNRRVVLNRFQTVIGSGWFATRGPREFDCRVRNTMLRGRSSDDIDFWRTCISYEWTKGKREPFLALVFLTSWLTFGFYAWRYELGRIAMKRIYQRL